MVLYTAEAILGKPLSDKQAQELSVLAWLVQLQTSYILVCDDMVDRSTIRRGQPTWWCRPEISQTAVSDAFILNFCIYYLLKLHLKGHPAYIDLVEYIQENSFLTEIGQSGDHLIASKGRSGFDGFTMENYDFIITHKGGHFYTMGAMVALIYLELGTPTNVKQILDVALAFGKYAQVQDDFLDAFADPAATGKVGTDIEENKCTWLIIQALQRCTPDLRAVLESAYGTEDAENVAKVKAIYRDLRLDEVYCEYERKAVAEIKAMINQVDERDGLRKAVFDIMPGKVSYA
jgi:farnesyl diphosphate synthase